MKRMLISLAAPLLLAAPSAQAASFSLDVDASHANVGETVTLTVIVEVGTETLDSFSAYGLQVGWDASKLAVANAGVSSTFGNAAQSPVLPGLSGSLTPTCANTGSICTIITQVNATPSPVNVGPATIIGSLELEVLGIGPAGLQITSFSNNGLTDPSEVELGANFQQFNLMIPEPTTAALLALGLAGLGLARRQSLS